jgi:hypothetical protein
VILLHEPQSSSLIHKTVKKEKPRQEQGKSRIGLLEMPKTADKKILEKGFKGR